MNTLIKTPPAKNATIQSANADRTLDVMETIVKFFSFYELQLHTVVVKLNGKGQLENAQGKFIDKHRDFLSVPVVRKSISKRFLHKLSDKDFRFVNVQLVVLPDLTWRIQLSW